MDKFRDIDDILIETKADLTEAIMRCCRRFLNKDITKARIDAMYETLDCVAWELIIDPIEEGAVHAD